MLKNRPSFKGMLLGNRAISFVNLCISSWLIVSIYMFDKFNASLNSTSFKGHQIPIFVFNNTFTDILYQSFGYYIYFIPFPFLFWSYQYFFKKINKVSNIAIVSFALSFVIVPTTISLIKGEEQGGVLGMLMHQTELFQAILPAFAVLSVLLCVNALNISLMMFFKFLVTILEVLIGLLITGFNFIKTAFATIAQIDLEVKLEDKTAENESITIKSINKNENTSKVKYTKPQNSQTQPMQSQNTEQALQTFEPEKIRKKEIEIKQEYKEQQEPTNTQNPHQESEADVYSVDTSMFKSIEDETEAYSKKDLIEQGEKIELILNEFGVSGVIDNIQTGPLITLFEFIPASGIKISKVVGLETDLALKLKVKSVRIAPVMGKNTLGVEVPNKVRKNVLLGPLLKPHKLKEHALPLALGKDIAGLPITIDLAKTPHMLVGGTTGSGKSVSINSMIISLIATLSPKDCKMIMIDPKMLELSVYEDIPHLLTPVVTNPEKAVSALKWAVREMEFRYFMMSQLGVRNIVNYNEKVKTLETPKKVLRQDLLALKNDENVDPKEYEVTVKHLPYIVVVIDEMADLMIVAGKEVEMLVQRLAQMARAAGIHVIMATQRPSVDVITGTIKANFPTRIAFQVSSKIDSRTILGTQGAESLLGKGDMLVMLGGASMKRVHGAFVSDKEVEDFVTNIKNNSEKPEYLEDITSEIKTQEGGQSGDQDELYNDVIEMIRQERKISTSFIQRKFQIGYNRAARIVDQLEENGIISPPSKTGKRDIFI